MVCNDPANYPSGGTHVEVKDQEYRHEVESLDEAQGIVFLCPKCLQQNNQSRPGVHSVEVSFAERGVKDNQGTHNSLGLPVRWHVSGHNFEDLTTQPSVLLTSLCGWHGFIAAGEVSIL